MAKKKQRDAIRPGGRRYEVYNEALCVYLYDETNSDALRELIAKKGDEGSVFYDNLSLPAFAKAVKAKSLALCYELRQDDEVYIEVIVGPPLTEEELAVARWLPVQRAKLSLPGGRLRINTPNTMPLDPEEPEDEGAVAHVPPGDYALSLYRVDWHACDCDEIKFKGPGEVIVLTPLEEAKKVPAGSPILEYPQPEVDEKWVGAYSIDGSRFECQVNFWDYWEFLRLNLDQNAVEKLGLTCGSVMRIQAGGLSVDLVFLGDITRQNYLMRVGQKEFDAKIANRPEVALGGWHEIEGRRILGFFRHKATKAVHIKFHEVWKPATGEVLPELFPLPLSAELPAAKVENGSVRASVVMAHDDLLIINATEKQLAALGPSFKLTLPNATHTVVMAQPDGYPQHVFLSGGKIPDGLAYLRIGGLRTFAQEGKIPKKADGFNIEVLPRKERRPVTGLFPPPTSDPTSKFLHVRQMYVDGNFIGFDWNTPPKAGTEVTLSN